MILLVPGAGLTAERERLAFALAVLGLPYCFAPDLVEYVGDLAPFSPDVVLYMAALAAHNPAVAPTTSGLVLWAGDGPNRVSDLATALSGRVTVSAGVPAYSGAVASHTTAKDEDC